MSKITIRPQKVSDAQRFFEILSNPKFIYFYANPKSVAEEKKFLKTNAQLRKKKIAYNYSVLIDNKVVGAVGLKINRDRPFMGEIGYFLDEQYWGQGIVVKAVKLLEKEAFKKLKLTRIEILMSSKNKASQKVAKKAGYKKEGLMKKAVADRDGKLKDAYLYAKVK